MKSYYLVALALLTGCTGGMTPLSGEDLATVTGGAVQGVTVVADTAAVKELAVHKTLQHRDQMIKESHAGDGFIMELVMVDVAPGVKALLPKTIGYRDAARFDQPLPTRPSEHPVWRTGENIAKTLIKAAVASVGIDAAAEVLNTGINAAKASTTYAGNYSAGNVGATTTVDDHRQIDQSVGPVTDDHSVVSDYDTTVTTVADDHSVDDHSVGPVDNSVEDRHDVGPVDNSVGPVDNSVEDRHDVGPVDNSTVLPLSGDE